MQTDLDFHYYFDPLCGWCYASAPALAALAERHGDRLKMKPTGLFVAPRPVSAMADHAWTNDQRISKLTGQPFTEAYHRNVLLAPGGVFSSEALSLALAALGEIDPRLESRYLHAAQCARYVDGRDTSRPEIAAEIAAGIANGAGHAVTTEALAGRIRHDAALHGATEARFAASLAEMAAFGIRGVPQLVIREGGSHRIVDSAVLYGGGTALMALIDGLAQAA